ncbi:hypothetical protein EHS86_05495 [Erwinia amylovora]|nr:hypothetical protein AD997_17480 [Erwinia amylovora]RWS39261.1 hypothetical protein EHS86_05495 [Erwinia amylovora]
MIHTILQAGGKRWQPWDTCNMLYEFIIICVPYLCGSLNGANYSELNQTCDRRLSHALWS